MDVPSMFRWHQLETWKTEIKKKIDALNTHVSNKNNPHGVTATQVGAAREVDLLSHTNDFYEHIPLITLHKVEDEYGNEEMGYNFTSTEYKGKVRNGALVRVMFDVPSATKVNFVSVSDYPIAPVEVLIDAGPQTEVLSNSMLFDPEKVYLLKLHYPSSQTPSWLLMSNYVSSDFIHGSISIEKGGTGATTADAARKNLKAAPEYTYGTADLIAGTSPLETGKLYFVYE